VTSPEGDEREYVLACNQYTVGRAAPNHEPDIVLAPDPEGWISRLHCILDLETGKWWVTNHGKNGTLLRREAPGGGIHGGGAIGSRMILNLIFAIYFFHHGSSRDTHNDSMPARCGIPW